MFDLIPLMALALAAAALSLASYLPYLIDTLRGRTQPQRASWFIWSVLSAIALAAQVYEGATLSLWFAAVQCGATCIIFFAAIPYGTGGLRRRADRKTLLAAGFGILLWVLTDNATYALAISIGVSLLGGSVTVAKAYADPDSETMITWVLSFVASACAIAAVGRLDPVLLADPAYLLTLNVAIVAAILLARLRLPPLATPQAPPVRAEVWASEQRDRKASTDTETPELPQAA